MSAVPCPTPQSGTHPAVADSPAPSRPSEGLSRWVAIGLTALGLVLSVLAAYGTSAATNAVRDTVIQALRADLTQHTAAPNHSGGAALSERLAVVETKVGAILESVARIEQAQRDDRAERRSGGPR